MSTGQPSTGVLAESMKNGSAVSVPHPIQPPAQATNVYRLGDVDR